MSGSKKLASKPQKHIEHIQLKSYLMKKKSYTWNNVIIWDSWEINDAFIEEENTRERDPELSF